MEPNKNRKVIVAVAPVGKGIQPPSVNPLTPEEVADEVIACSRAGASFVHLHVRDDKGNQTEDRPPVDPWMMISDDSLIRSRVLEK